MKKYLKALFLIAIFASCTKYSSVYACGVVGKEELPKRRYQGSFDDSITDEQVEKFLNDLKAAVNNNDKKAVADLVHFPCEWSRRGKRVIEITRENFLYHYNSIITEHIKEVINKAKVETVIAKYSGFRMGDGEIWFVPPEIFLFNPPIGDN